MNQSIDSGFKVMGDTFTGSWRAILLLIGIFLLAWWLLKYKVIK